MNAQETTDIIERAGGDTAFARLLGLPQTVGVQRRVNNWKRRGMPARIQVEHYETLQALRSRLEQEREAA